MANENTPCTKPELCGVKSHRPGTQALCMKTGSAAQGATSNLGATPLPQVRQLSKGEAMFLNEWVPAMILDEEIDRCAEGIVNEDASEDARQGFEDSLMNRISALGGKVDEECWVAFNSIISNKEMPPRSKDDTKPFGNEHLTRSTIHGQPSLKIEAGGRGGQLFFDEYEDNALTMQTDQAIEYGFGVDEDNVSIYKNSKGELWITSKEIPGHKFGAPMRIKDLKEGDRHWVQDDNNEPEGEHAYYELARRLYSNPVTRRYLETHAPESDPGIDDRYQKYESNPYFTPPRN